MGRREFIKVIGGATDIPIEQPTKFDLPSISARRRPVILWVGSWLMESHEPEGRLPPSKETGHVEKFVVPDPAQCYRCLRRSRYRQPPSAALGRSGRSTLKPALEARRFQDG